MNNIDENKNIGVSFEETSFQFNDTDNMQTLTKSKYIAREIAEWVICILIALILAYITKYYIGTFSTIQQQSMYPTIENNDKLWLNRLPRTRKEEYKRGEIVTFEAPIMENAKVNNEHPKALYQEIEGVFNKFTHCFLEFGKYSLIKRVIAVPGDNVEIKNGNVYINGERLYEEYLPEDTVTNSVRLDNFKVPEGYYFLVGDNREHSTDGRNFGVVPKEKIEGRAVLRVWPINHFGKVE